MAEAMTITATSQISPLDAGVMVHIDDPRGMAFTSVSGDIWITQLGDKRDHVLRSGETLVLDKDGPALASALGGIAFLRTSPAPLQCVAA